MLHVQQDSSQILLLVTLDCLLLHCPAGTYSIILASDNAGMPVNTSQTGKKSMPRFNVAWRKESTVSPKLGNTGSQLLRHPRREGNCTE